jgi:hypothetical protein
VASLRELQQSFAAALRDDSLGCAVHPVTHLTIYRHNAEFQFHQALAIGFPVLRRRVGADFFRQLTHHYRRLHPSRSGDLHWVGRDFPGFLAGHLRDGEYAWLADLARLEWAREMSLIAEWRAPLGAEVLSRFAAEDLEGLTFSLQPSLGLIAAAHPVFSVWHANQVENAPPVSQSLGAEQGLVLCRQESIEVIALPLPRFLFLDALRRERPLGDAMSEAGLDEAGLLAALHFVFTQGLVCAVDLPSH